MGDRGRSGAATATCSHATSAADTAAEGLLFLRFKCRGCAQGISIAPDISQMISRILSRKLRALRACRSFSAAAGGTEANLEIWKQRATKEAKGRDPWDAFASTNADVSLSQQAQALGGQWGARRSAACPMAQLCCPVFSRRAESSVAPASTGCCMRSSRPMAQLLCPPAASPNQAGHRRHAGVQRPRRG